ncbi:reprolysin-like metallopeptidase [endosymbiont of Ridgeia piscesae]|uniref:Metallo-peptidase family M12B Reprolysin-like n=1 Tax=endosymbiont of Ridgeia piscesae TaxID=54398 RepID=A0A0T5YT46_9GAMM|nr:zinc-dependent metalloprotease family protein [endosymbiont of Ridgeia piscesae]KRT53827.1 Metallo-peptidase family M12B Reprolysin-like [endosymbiont of Ridgeia piscesae]KRT59266.1 Metallo-peptidase family M12B Reprolysin-like [endosymbiont of Ridgeia piscesae]
MGFGSRFMVWLLLLGLPLGGVSASGIWSERLPDVAARSAAVPAFQYRSLQADRPALESLLATAPLEFTASEGAPLQLPLPDGSFARFSVEESPIMAPELARRYPEIRTYSVRGIDQPTATGRLDLTPQGFHAMLDTPAGVIFIDPDDQGGYRSYFKRDYVLAARGELSSRPYCVLQEVEQEHGWEQRVAEVSALAQRLTGQRRVYRLAVAATGEYTQFHGGTNAQALDAIVTAINRVNQIYGRDLAIQFQLVADNDRIIYTDSASDPYDNSSAFDMLGQNQANLDRVIGSDNYDIGHVFSTYGGGIAVVPSACSPHQKAKGVSGRRNPSGESFFIDFVAHEIGHQFAADHTFNGSDGACISAQRVAASAVEPGSGTTIMAYAGICGAENLQYNTDATFHAWSIQQVNDYVASGGSCGTLVATGNTPPSVDAGADYIIPRQTPFRLLGAANDTDGDELSFQWDGLDRGAVTSPETLGSDLGADPASGNNPLFRSFLPKSSGERTFPRISQLLLGLDENDSTSAKGETLPASARVMNFRLTVRDGNSGVAADDVRISVDSASGPLEITGGELVSGTSLMGGGTYSLEWSTNTTAICGNMTVELLSLSSDYASYCDGTDLPELILGSFANAAGSAMVTLPDLQIDRARVRLACSDNIFFTLSDGLSIEVQGNGVPVAGRCKATDGATLEHGTQYSDASDALGAGAEAGRSEGGGGGLFWMPLMLLLAGSWGLAGWLRQPTSCSAGA